MKSRILVVGFVLSIVLISLIGIYTLNINQKIIKLFEDEDRYFKDIATAATELSSYAKRAEGHLLLYLVLHRQSDKDKFPRRMASLQERVLILDQKIQNHEARTILDNIKANSAEVVTAGNALIAYHDQSMGDSGAFKLGQYRDEVFRLHDNFSAIRKYGVELATLEIDLEHKLKLEVSENTASLQFYMLAMISLISLFALFLGYVLIKMINSLNSEISSRIQSENIIKSERNRLEDALERVKILSGLLPICAECKNIRDDKGYWNQIESYIRNHSEAEFSHSICPSCLKKLYPEYYKDKE